MLLTAWWVLWWALLVVGVMCHRLLDGLRWGEALYETLYAFARLVAVDDRGWSVGGRTFLVLSGAVMGLLAVPSLCRPLRRARGT